MSSRIHTFKGQNIKVLDSFVYDSKECSINLDQPNRLKDKLIVLYVYQLEFFHEHGYKVGMTTCNIGETIWEAIKKRVDSQKQELALGNEDYERYGYEREVVFWGICINDLEGDFKDHRIHAELMKKYPGQAEKNQEWFTNVPLKDIENIFLDYRTSNSAQEEEYNLREEQQEAINNLVKYFKDQDDYKGRFLLNCKMRFGKCYTVYRYAELDTKDKPLSKKILILTFVPAVEDSWRTDLKHIKTRYQYFTDKDLRKNGFNLDDDPKTPYVVFVSLQNLLGKETNKDNAIHETKEKIKKLGKVAFDLLILDEYHFGAWNDKTQKRIKNDTNNEIVEDIDDEQYISEVNKGIDPVDRFQLKAKQTICLSGTPFKALERSEFEQNAIYTYTYFDEQKRKYPNYKNQSLDSFKRLDPVEPYNRFPDMSIYGYAMGNLFGGLDETFYEKMDILGKDNYYFSLNTFFKTAKDFDSKATEDKFVYEEQIKEWLLILVQGKPGEDSIFPYQLQLRGKNRHSLWLLPTINSCLAMEKLLIDSDFFGNYQIINISDPRVGTGQSALNYLNNGIMLADSPVLYKSGTITLTVNKLTLGVTVPEWSAVFVLKDLTSPEQYFQSIFRIQNPWIVNGQIKKTDVSVYDFNIDRAAALIIKFASYENDGTWGEKTDIPELILKFMPIYTNGNLQQSIDEDVLRSLASFSESGGRPISKMLKQIDDVTNLTSDAYANIVKDERAMKILGQAHAYTKFKPTSSKNKNIKIGEVETNQISYEFREGQKIGYDTGKENYKKYIYLDNSEIQIKINEAIEKLISEKCPTTYDNKQRTNFSNGVNSGFIKGIGVPVKNMKCGESDGYNFAKKLLEENNNNLVYNDSTKRDIKNKISIYLNDDNNIPEKYKGIIFNKFYKTSFQSAAIRALSPRKIKTGETTQGDIDNAILHIITKVFQFLYISVYREMSFDEILKHANADDFKSAVGITKEDFEYLNDSFKFINESYLDSCVSTFFQNETLGKNLSPSDKNKDLYRNSFNWFGFGIER